MSTGRDSERRYVSILFADISGFTAMSERLDPEEVTTIVNGCFVVLDDIVKAHGGHVDKHIGDCVMAVFGAPHGLEDAAKQAVNAAIEMRNRIEAFCRAQRLSVPLGLHVGINSGLVVAGEMGGVKRDFTVVGDAVNVASRLKDASPVGSIYVGQSTHRDTAEDFEYRTLRPLDLKGKGDPVPAFELLTVRERVHRRRSITSNLVGRESELRHLRESIDKVLAGVGGIVSVVGEAGLGKSRLLAEVTGPGATELHRRALVLEGRSLSVGQGLSFHPFVDLLRRWAGISDEDSEETALARLEAGIGGVAPESVDELLPFVATLMGMRVGGAHAARLTGVAGEALEKVILKSMRELLRRLAAARPVVLVFEDLHWADTSSVQLLEVLLRLVSAEPILFIDVFRPSSDGVPPRILAASAEACPGHVVVQLERLTDRDADALVANLLAPGEVPRAARALIRGRAEGNPFFIEEVVRSLIDAGVIEYRDDRFRVSERIHSVVIPGTIQDVIMARVDRLDERVRHLLRVASVMGRSFYHRVLLDLVGDYPGLAEDLAVLRERQLIFERPSRRTADVRRKTMAPEMEFVFKHALVQETVYESLLHKTRKELHLNVAGSIEKHFADRLGDFYGMLALHYSRADSLEKAEEYLLKAGEEAARSAASSEALGFFREASRVFLRIHGDQGDPLRKALIEKNIGLALHNKGNLMECMEHFDRALTLYGDPPSSDGFRSTMRFCVDLLAVLYRLYTPVPRLRPARVGPNDAVILEIRYRRGLAQATSDPRRFFFDTIGSIRRVGRIDAAAIGDACGMYAGAAAAVAFSGTSFAIARRFLDMARRLARDPGSRDHFLYGSMAFIYNFLAGEWVDVDEDLVAQGLRYGQLWDVTAYLGFWCTIRARRGDFAGCQRLLERISEINDVYAYEFGKSHVSSQTAILLVEQRRLKAALEAIDAYYASRHEDVLNVLALGMRAKTQLLLDDRPGAADTLERAAQLVRRAGQVPPWHLSNVTIAQLRSGLLTLERDGAGERELRRVAREAVHIATRVAEVRPEVYRLLGRREWLLGRRSKALGWWERGIGEGERLGMRPEVARTHFEVGTRVGGAEGERRVALARETFVLLDLAWDIERVDACARRSAAA